MTVPSLQTASLVILTAFILMVPTSSLAQETSTLDLIVEADTYVPHFYAGRTEPTVGNDVRFVAISTSDAVPASYRWRVGNQYTSSTDPYLRLTLPLTGQRTLVEVTALDIAGEPLGRVAEYIDSSEPLLLFYEENALRGTARIALSNGLILIGDETTVKAEPYFAGAKSPLSLRANWSSDLPIESVGIDWRFLYVRRDDTDRPSGEVQLQVSNPENLNEYLTGSFNVSL